MLLNRLLSLLTIVLFGSFLSVNSWAMSCKSLLSGSITSLTPDELSLEVESATRNLSTRQKADIILSAARGEGSTGYFSPQVEAGLQVRMSAESVGDLLGMQAGFLYAFDLLKSDRGKQRWIELFNQFKSFALNLGVTVQNVTPEELLELDLSNRNPLDFILSPGSSYINSLPPDELMRGHLKNIINQAVADYRRDVYINEAVVYIPLVQRSLTLDTDEYVRLISGEDRLKIYELSDSPTGYLSDTGIQHWFSLLVIENIVRTEIDRLQQEGLLNWPKLSGQAYDQRVWFLSQFPEFLVHINNMEVLFPIKNRVMNLDYESSYEHSPVIGLDDYWISISPGRDYDTDVLSGLIFYFSLSYGDLEEHYDGYAMGEDNMKKASDFLNEKFSAFISSKGLNSSNYILEISDSHTEIIASVEVKGVDSEWSTSISLTLEFMQGLTDQTQRYDDQGQRLILQ